VVQEPSLEEGTWRPSWSTALWLQFGAAIEMLENALLTHRSHHRLLIVYSGALGNRPVAVTEALDKL
jgi:hypothetical protein